MGIVFAVGLMAWTPSLFVTFIPAAIVWIPIGRKREATAPVGQGALRHRLRRLRLLATPQVVLAPLVLRRSSTSSLPSSEPARRPCRIGGGGFIFYRLLGWCLLL